MCFCRFVQRTRGKKHLKSGKVTASSIHEAVDKPVCVHGSVFNISLDICAPAQLDLSTLEYKRWPVLPDTFNCCLVFCNFQSSVSIDFRV